MNNYTLKNNQRGTSTIEYLLLCSFALLAITSVSTVDSKVNGQLDRYRSAISGGIPVELLRGGGTDSSNDQGGNYDPAYDPDGDGEEGAPPPDEPPSNPPDNPPDEEK